MNAEVMRLFDEACQIPLDERSAFLRQCDDPTLRREVESLLNHDNGSETTFAVAVQSAAASLRAHGELAPGDRLGVYEIQSVIGRGGMGTVYLAARADGTYHQLAAVKVLHAGNAGFLLERFQQERRILALLNHPNIAHILDGGQAGDGMLWYAMEYVPGLTIEHYREQKKLSIHATLEMFLRVCDAVRHAHQSLVVHRDLKPANILVTEAGEPKLLDFGIAKVLDPARLDNASTRLLTPEYASPEQIQGNPVTTATDIYSLGAVLYKLLTGQAPHSLRGISPLEAARVITEEEVPAASAVRHGIPRDVDSILHRALHKDAPQRYQSVEELAADIGRYLQGRPVLAVPSGAAYRAARYLKRNAVVAALSASAALSLVAGTVISVNQARRAQQRFQQVRQLANVFLFDFEKSIEDIPGTLEARKLVAATARQYLEQLAPEAKGDAGLQREIATAYEKLAAIQASLQSGKNELEIDGLRTALEIRRGLGDDRSTDPVLRKEFIGLASRLAAAYHMVKNSAESVKWDEAAVRLARIWVDDDSSNAEALDAAHAALLQQGRRLETAGRVSLAVAAMKESLRLAGEALRQEPESVERKRNVAAVEYQFANMLLNMKERDQALAHARHAVAISEPLYRGEPSDSKVRVVYQHSLSSAGIVNRALSKFAPGSLPAAVSFLEKAHGLALEDALADSKNAAAQDNLITQCHRLANSLVDSGKLDKAAALYEEGGEAVRKLIALNPAKRRHWYLSAANTSKYGDLRTQQGRLAEARTLYRSADAAFERALAMDPHDAVILEMLASQLEALAFVEEGLGNPQAARSYVNRYLDVLCGMIERDPSAKKYIGDYESMITRARRLGISTRNLPEP